MQVYLWDNTGHFYNKKTKNYFKIFLRHQYVGYNKGWQKTNQQKKNDILFLYHFISVVVTKGNRP